MPDLLDRRTRDLEEQFETLPRELAYWRDLSRQRSYEKHHSQIAALSAQMQALNDRVKAAWNGSADFVAIQKARRDCATVHGVWHYFREKLVVRADSALGGYLRAADAYVWACYEPVLADRRRTTPTQPFREPPLVAFDSDPSPWALARGRSFVPQGLVSATRGEAFVKALEAMPIAVIGTPWHTSALLPGLVALAHETGHVVETDFDLGPAVSAALAAATASSALSEGWSTHWEREVFADLFACYVAGPASAWVLADSVPDPPDKVSTRVRPSGDEWGPYPPATLRMLLNVTALRMLGYQDDADAIEQYWKADYPTHAMGAFEQDLPAVVEAVYRAADLPATLRFSTLAAQRARVRKVTVLHDSALDLKETYDPRALVSVAWEQHRQPTPGVDRHTLWSRLQTHIVDARPPGLLAAQKSTTGEMLLRTDDIAALIFSNEPEP